MDWIANILIKWNTNLIMWLSWLVVMGVGLHLLLILLLAKLQFYVAVLFGPVALLLWPVDRGRVLQAAFSMMVSSVATFMLAFAIVSFAISALNGMGQAMLEVAQQSKEDATWAPLLMAAAGFLLSLIIFIINQQISGWANQLFGGIGFSTRTADRMAGAAGRQLGRNLSNAAKGAGKGAGRGMWGGAKGAITGRASQGGPGAVKGALRGAWQGIRKQDIDPTQPLLGKKKK
jgi:hypothetical protein